MCVRVHIPGNCICPAGTHGPRPTSGGRYRRDRPFPTVTPGAVLFRPSPRRLWHHPNRQIPPAAEAVPNPGDTMVLGAGSLPVTLFKSKGFSTTGRPFKKSVITLAALGFIANLPKKSWKCKSLLPAAIGLYFLFF